MKKILIIVWIITVILLFVEFPLGAVLAFWMTIITLVYWAIKLILRLARRI